MTILEQLVSEKAAYTIRRNDEDYQSPAVVLLTADEMSALGREMGIKGPAILHDWCDLRVIDVPTTAYPHRIYSRFDYLLRPRRLSGFVTTTNCSSNATSRVRDLFEQRDQRAWVVQKPAAVGMTEFAVRWAEPSYEDMRRHLDLAPWRDGPLAALDDPEVTSIVSTPPKNDHDVKSFYGGPNGGIGYLARRVR